ncbi:hypothetical protein WJ96_04270 [Burkholderia ubonensis]|uniref:PcfJ-like protein n=2 Tax=Burkholderia ubonensis TaxID=101571 RepID=A0AAW3MW23_9BURK|nr:hypothetical protein WJ93_24015 [Burkholderia ubonensis]KVP97790.1 hypothetical protein WJ96_04270 [Burkholderia ubonensis]KVZ92487.1 hypothetical protein WL25_15925 [Burkholderia ubonensis]
MRLVDSWLYVVVVNFQFEVNMETRADFSSELVASLQAAQASGEPGEPRLFMKAVLALRAWYRHEAILHKPELIVQHTADVFEVYGDVRVERNAGGELKVMVEGKEQTLRYIEVSSISRYLANQARGSIRRDYRERAKALIRSQGLEPENEAAVISLLDLVDDHLGARHNVNWWRRKSTLADDSRVLGRLIWDAGILDREIFGLATRLAGFRFSVHVYNQCVPVREDLKARIKEAPHMAPWLLAPDYRQDGLRVHQTVWKDLKERFMSMGGTPQAWKWLCNQGHSWFRLNQLTEAHVNAVTAIAALQLGKVPHHPGLFGLVVRYVVNEWRTSDPRFLDVFKAAMVAHKKRKLKVADFSNYVLIRDYLMAVPTATTKGATWASLMRKQHVWHMEEARREMERRKEADGCLGWAPMVQMLQQGDLEAISLNNSDDLWEEGTAMSHCVGGYDQACYQNESRIYSIRRNGERVSTLEIRRVAGKLTIGQNYGPGNSIIKDVAVTRLAKRVLSACNRAPELNPADNTVIREPKRAAPPARHDALPANDARYEEDQEDIAAIPF